MLTLSVALSSWHNDMVNAHSSKRNMKYEDDLTKLKTLLEKEGIEFTYRKHPAAEHEPGVKDLIGYFPSGEHQILVGENSIIRGMVSFEYYEIYNPSVDSDPVRTETAGAMLEEIKTRLKPTN